MTETAMQNFLIARSILGTNWKEISNTQVLDVNNAKRDTSSRSLPLFQTKWLLMLDVFLVMRQISEFSIAQSVTKLYLTMKKSYLYVLNAREDTLLVL